MTDDITRGVFETIESHINLAISGERSVSTQFPLEARRLCNRDLIDMQSAYVLYYKSEFLFILVQQEYDSYSHAAV